MKTKTLLCYLAEVQKFCQNLWPDNKEKVSTFKTSKSFVLNIFSKLPSLLLWAFHQYSIFSSCRITRNEIVSLLVPVGQIFHDLEQMQRNAGQVTSETDLSVELIKIASDKGFTISDNDGSGNCMFYALCDQLDLVKRIQISHEELRQSVVQYLKENPTLVS